MTGAKRCFRTDHVCYSSNGSDAAASESTHVFSDHIFSAMIAGATSTTCTSPLWVIKTRTMVRHSRACLQQLQGSSDPDHLRYRNTLDAAFKIWKSEGVLGFYKGLLPSLLGVAHVVVQFPLYEYFKRCTRTSAAGTRLRQTSLNTTNP